MTQNVRLSAKKAEELPYLQKVLFYQENVNAVFADQGNPNNYYIFTRYRLIIYISGAEKHIEVLPYTSMEHYEIVISDETGTAEPATGLNFKFGSRGIISINVLGGFDFSTLTGDIDERLNSK